MATDPDTRSHLGIPCRAAPEMWFANDPADRAAAAEACGHCPVLHWCRTTILPRELALTRWNRWGIVAGIDLEAVEPTDAPQPGLPTHLDLPRDERPTSLRDGMPAEVA
jgi:hypothetical protein